MGIEHEFIHFQTSISLIRQVPCHLISPPTGWESGSLEISSLPHNEWLSFSGGPVTLGREKNDCEYFGWDNEYGQVNLDVMPFKVRKYPITNREFLDFILDNGYETSEFWQTQEVDVWFSEMQPKYPAAWIHKGGHNYKYRAIFSETDMPWDAPVEVNKHEAAAYAIWSGARLINEKEYHYLFQQDFVSEKHFAQARKHLNINLRYCNTLPVYYCAPYLESTVTGVDLVGNVARWIDGDFKPYQTMHLALTLYMKSFPTHGFVVTIASCSEQVLLLWGI